MSASLKSVNNTSNLICRCKYGIGRCLGTPPTYVNGQEIKNSFSQQYKRYKNNVLGCVTLSKPTISFHGLPCILFLPCFLNVAMTSSKPLLLPSSETWFPLIENSGPDVQNCIIDMCIRLH